MNWELHTGQPDSHGWCSSIVDYLGNTYLTGNTQVLNEGTNLYVTKCDKFGNLIWEYEYNHSFNGDDYGVGITIDDSQNVYVIGTSKTSVQNDFDFTLLRLNSTGILSWVQHYNGEGSSEDIGLAISLDANSYIIVTGVAVGDSTDKDYTTIKYSNGGNLEWVANYDYHNLYDIPVDLEVNDNNDIIVTGASSDNITKWDIATIRYNSDGVKIGERREPGSALGFDRPISLSKDISGNFYITGIALNSSSNYDIRTIKLDSVLNLIWSVDYDGYSMYDEPADIAIDNDGNVVITGITEKNGQKIWITLKYSSVGSLLWEKEIQGKDSYDALGKSVSVDPTGKIIITGSRYVYDNMNVCTLLLQPDSKTIWNRIYTPDTSGDEYPIKIEATGSNSFSIIGIADWSPREYFILQYNYINKIKVPFVDTNGINRYIKDQLLISFNRDSLDKVLIADQNKEFGTLEDYLGQSNADILINQLPPTVSSDNIILKKVSKRINPFMTHTLNSNGDSIPMTSDWNDFWLLLDCNGQESLIIDSLQKLFPFILGVGYNKLRHHSINTSFPYKGTNDLHYDDQYHLHGRSVDDFDDENWECNSPAPNMTILIPNYIKIDNSLLNSEVVIGAFYLDQDTYKCGGLITFDLSTEPNTAISIFAATVLTPGLKNGFESGEEIFWVMKFSDPDKNTFYYMEPTFTDFMGVTGTNHYSTNEYYVLSMLSGETGHHINIETAWHMHQGISNVRIGVVDSGVDYTHFDIRDDDDYIDGYDYQNNQSYSINSYANWDSDFTKKHGTTMVGLIAAERNNINPGTGNFEGVAGICGYNVDTGTGIPVFVAGCQEGSGIDVSDDNVYEFFNDLIDSQSAINQLYGLTENIKVLNLSFGEPDDDPYVNYSDDRKWKRYLRKLDRKDIAVVAGRGNLDPGFSETDEVHPATYYRGKKTIVVSGSDIDGLLAIETMYDDYLAWPNKKRITVAAPGDENIVYSLIGTASDGYSFMGGTSASTAITSGVIGLMQSYYFSQTSTYLNVDEVKEIVSISATDINIPGFDQYSGNGLLNAGKMLLYADVSAYAFFTFEYIPYFMYPETLTAVIIPDEIDAYDINNDIIVVPAGTYDIIAYKYGGTNSHSLGNYSLVTGNSSHGCVVNSKCELLGYPIQEGNDLILEAFSDVQFTSTPTAFEADLVGYCYKITSTISTVNGSGFTTQDSWFPFNPFFPGADPVVFYYSIFGINSGLINVPELHVSTELNIKVFPNPGSIYVNIEVENSGKIDGKILIIDITGKLLITKDINGYDNIVFNQNIEHLNNGNYFISVLLNDGSYKSASFIKIE